MRSRLLLVAVLASSQAACFSSISANEHCLLTRYRKVVDERMEPGLTLTPFTSPECFPLLDQNYPEDPKIGAVEFTAMAKDSIMVHGLFSWVWAHNPNEIPALYRAKGSRENAEQEIIQGALTGLQNAIAQFRSDDLYSKPEQVNAALKTAIDRVEQGRAVTKRAFVRNVLPPPEILAGRLAVQQRNLAEIAARRQLAVDSAQALGKVIQANATSEAKRLEAQSYAQNPKLLELEAAKAMANICQGVTTCILGGSTADALFLRKN